VSGYWPWLALAMLGAYHGLNPGMGWLFAVARGLQEGRRREVLRSLFPIAAGHEASLAVILGGVSLAQFALNPQQLRIVAAGALGVFAVLVLLRRWKHPRRTGMRVGLAGLGAWSFLMSTAHGAGLMLLPVLFSLPRLESPGGQAVLAPTSAEEALAAISLHTAAMLLVMGLTAVVVYERIGVGFLRRRWFNFDLAWGVSLAVAAPFVLFT
jgi:hypothetical protein